MPKRSDISSMQMICESKLDIDLSEVEELSVEHDTGKLYSIDKEGKQVYLGEVTAIALTLKSGRTIYSGKPEGIFNLRCTDEDKKELSDMKIDV